MAKEKFSPFIDNVGKFKYKIWRQDSSDKAWWVEQSSENVSEELRKDSSPNSPLSRRGSSRGSAKSERRSRIKHQQSGERAWWLSEDPESVPEGVEMIQVPRALTPQEADNPRTIGGPIRHIDSGEKAWWMDSSANVPEGVEKIRPADTSISNSDSSESLEKVEIGLTPRTELQIRRSLSRFPIEFPPPPPDEPLGDRASPEGVSSFFFRFMKKIVDCDIAASRSRIHQILRTATEDAILLTIMCNLARKYLTGVKHHLEKDRRLFRCSSVIIPTSTNYLVLLILRDTVHRFRGCAEIRNASKVCE